MIEHLDELLDKNLKLICEANNQQIFSHKFLDINNRNLSSKVKGEQFSKLMLKEDLISKKFELCTASRFGYEIYKKGGWLKHLEEVKLMAELDQVIVSGVPKKEIDWLKVTSIALAFILGVATIYQRYDYWELKKDYRSLEIQSDSLKLKYDSLISESLIYKDSLSQMRHKENRLKLESLTDISKTKN